MRTHVLQTYVHQIYDKSDAVTTFATVMNYQICDAHSAASYAHCVSFMWQIYVQRYLCVCVSAPHSAAGGGNICWSGEDSSGSMRFWVIGSSAFFISFFFCWDWFTIPKSPSDWTSHICKVQGAPQIFRASANWYILLLTEEVLAWEFCLNIVNVQMASG